MAEKWYTKAFRRNVIDMHIEDWDPKFLSQFDAKTYVNLLKTAKVDSAVVYAHSHVGYCNYPTKAGHMHKGLKGRDIFKEVTELCHKNKIKVVAYYSLIFNNWAYDNNPDWRIVRIDGTEAAASKENPNVKGSRYGVCCPNSPYREFIKKEITEICKNYAFEGIRFDMTFWPTVCYCKHCQRRYAAEVGGEMPRKIDWNDPRWVALQRCREKWLVELAAIATNLVRELRPEVSVEHQSSTFPLTWQFGVTTELSKQCDFLQGDFYGGELQASFVCKFLYNLTPNQPFGYETSATYHLGNSYKPKEVLRTQCFGAIANGGAFIFIDAIDPVGTIYPPIYKTMGEIFQETKAYDDYIGGELCQDVGIYLSTESKFHLYDNPEDDAKVTTNCVNEVTPHAENAFNAAQALIYHNIPFGVITKESLKDLSKYKIIIIPNAITMSQKEADAFKEYVKNGGNLYGSKYTSLYTPEGKITDFILADVFGISYKGKTEENMTYIAPTKDGQKLLKNYSPKYPMSIAGSQMIVQAEKSAKVLATVTLPYTNPLDRTKFASIHCNPPGIETKNPAVVLNKYGKGKAIYVAADLEIQEYHRDAFISLIKSMYSGPFSFESDAPKVVEITMFDQPQSKRYLVNILNFQKVLPSIPVENINIKLNIKGKKIKKVVLIPSNKSLKFKAGKGTVEFTLPKVDVFSMIAVQYA